MKIISVSSLEVTHLALVPSAVTNADCPAIYYNRAAFPKPDPSDFIIRALRQCLLDAQLYTVLDAFL